MYKQREEGS
jgi:hypothetical protein